MRHTIRMDQKDDRYYISKVLKGDVQAFSYLVDKYQDMVFTLAFRILKNRENAEEVAQDSFVKVYQNLGKFRSKSKFSTWLYRIVYNTAISRVRVKQKTTMSIDNQKFFEIGDDDQNVSKSFDIENNKMILQRLLNKLDESDRALITLYYLDECKVSEISEITGQNRSNIKVKLHRTRKKMQEELHKIMKSENVEII
ncbi:MAG: sigma-70 family RNA polymerase sigma factor [Bacteroidales bacterium]|nr:sigma-70 family RNA polymerase sigma factor [Bacteroidales bacterium]